MEAPPQEWRREASRADRRLERTEGEKTRRGEDVGAGRGAKVECGAEKWEGENRTSADAGHRRTGRGAVTQLGQRSGRGAIRRVRVGRVIGGVAAVHQARTTRCGHADRGRIEITREREHDVENPLAEMLPAAGQVGRARSLRQQIHQEWLVCLGGVTPLATEDQVVPSIVCRLPLSRGYVIKGDIPRFRLDSAIRARGTVLRHEPAPSFGVCFPAG